jgi:gamma-glutamyl-gamma-aminobutyraldehyde dehydrogenase
VSDQDGINALRSKVIALRGLLIGGKIHSASDEATLEILYPLDGRVLTTVAAGTAFDTNNAIS